MIIVKDSDSFNPKVNGNKLLLKIEQFTQIYLYIYMTGSGTGFNLTVKMKDKKYKSDPNFYEMYIYNGTSLVPFSINADSTLVGKRFVIPLIFPMSSDEAELSFNWLTSENDLEIFINTENVYA